MISGSPCKRQAQSHIASYLGWLGQLDHLSEKPAEIVSDVEEKEAADWDEEGPSPSGVFVKSGYRLKER